MSMHMSDAYHNELLIRRSYLFPDKDQLVLITIKENPALLAGELEIQPFVFQTNPVREKIFRKGIPMMILVKINEQLEKDGLGFLFTQLVKAPIGIIEVVRPTERSYRFWNAFGREEVLSEDARNAPLKVYAYLTEFQTTNHYV